MYIDYVYVNAWISLYVIKMQVIGGRDGVSSYNLKEQKFLILNDNIMLGKYKVNRSLGPKQCGRLGAKSRKTQTFN